MLETARIKAATFTYDTDNSLWRTTYSHILSRGFKQITATLTLHLIMRTNMRANTLMQRELTY